MNLIDSWRWFGDDDPITLEYIKMTGVKNIVSGLHEIPIGSIWEFDTIMNHKNKIEKYNLKWSVVESIPVHESIKYGGNERDLYINNYIESIKNISKAGINILCYNFMPIVDWTRTNLKYPNEDGSFCLRFDIIDFIIFDVFILKRSKAHNNYTSDQIQKAQSKYTIMKTEDINTLTSNILKGLPGSMVSSTDSLDSFNKKINLYKDIDSNTLKNNLKYFLKKIAPIAEEFKVYLAIHPDDPPINLFNIPRIVSNLYDLEEICNYYPSEYNGITLCVGSLASNPDNNINLILDRIINKINFVHLRNVICDINDKYSFIESNHLLGDIDFLYLIKKIISLDNKIIYYRPDHGDLLFDEIYKSNINPGYSLVGRFRGLSEIRGIISTIRL